MDGKKNPVMSAISGRQISVYLILLNWILFINSQNHTITTTYNQLIKEKKHFSKEKQEYRSLHGQWT